MFLADILSAAVTDKKWNGAPPHRDEAVNWIETNLRADGLAPVARERQTRPEAVEFVRRETPSHG
jgi:hypothetical protein